MFFFPNEHLEVQENWRDGPNGIANDVFGIQINEWKEFLINSDLSTGKLLKYFQVILFLKLLFLRLLKDMIITPNNY